MKNSSLAPSAALLLLLQACGPGAAPSDAAAGDATSGDSTANADAMVGSDGASGDSASSDSASAQESGSGGVQGSCDSRAASGSCTEHAGYDMATLGVLQSGCASSMGTWSASACPRTGAVGGCRTTSGGSTDTQWAYQGDAAMLRSFCAMGGGTFVSP